MSKTSNPADSFKDDLSSSKIDLKGYDSLFRSKFDIPHKGSFDKLENEALLQPNKWLSQLDFKSLLSGSAFSKVISSVGLGDVKSVFDKFEKLQGKGLLTYTEFMQKHGGAPNLPEDLDPLGFLQSRKTTIKNALQQQNVAATDQEAEELTDDINTMLYAFWNFHKKVVKLQSDTAQISDQWASVKNLDYESHAVLDLLFFKIEDYFGQDSIQAMSVYDQAGDITELFNFTNIQSVVVSDEQNLPAELLAKISDIGATSASLSSDVSKIITDFRDIVNAVFENIRELNPADGPFNALTEVNFNVEAFKRPPVFFSKEIDDTYNKDPSAIRASFLGHTSVSKLATDFGNKGLSVRDNADNATGQVKLNNAGATHANDSAAKIQQDPNVESTEMSTEQKGGKFGPFDEKDWDKFKQVLGKRESGNRYNITNKYKYMGRWQFGAGAITDGGYATHSNNRKLYRGSGWRGKDGVRSARDWLANKNGCQDKAMLIYTRRHYKTLLRKRIVTTRTKKSVVAGYLFCFHLLGLNGPWCIKYGRTLKGGRCADANGTTARSYYNLGKSAFADGYKSPDSVIAQKAAGFGAADQFAAATGETTVQDGQYVVVPQSAAAPKYPYNHVTEYEGGHFKEYDNTPGAERIQEKHKTGTGYEISPKGELVQTVVKDAYKAVLGNDFIVVHGNVQIIAHGDIGLNASGDLNLNAGNNINMIAGGSVVTDVGQDISTSAGGQLNVNISGDKMESIGGFSSNTSNGDMLHEGASVAVAGKDGEVNIISTENTNIMAVGETNIVGKKKTTLSSVGDTVVSSKANVAVGADGNLALFGKEATNVNTKNLTLESTDTKMKSTTHSVDTGSLSFKSSGSYKMDGSAVSIKSSGPVDCFVLTADWADRAAVAPIGSPGPKPPVNAGAGSAVGSGQYSHQSEHDDRQGVIGDKEKFDNYIVDQKDYESDKHGFLDVTKTQSWGGGAQSKQKGYREGPLKNSWK